MSVFEGLGKLLFSRQLKAQAATVSGTGSIYAINRLLGSTSTLALITGTNSNLTLSGSSIAATAALGSGASQTAIVRETLGQLAAEYPVILTGAVTAITAPSAPTLTVTPGNAQNTLSWTDGATGGAAITSHNLYAGPSAGALSLVGSIATASPYIDTGLTNGTARYYALTAVNSAGLESARATGSGTPAPAAYVIQNAEAQAYVNRMTVAPNDTYKAAVDKLWTRMKVGRINGSNIATAFDVFYIRALPTQQAALLNMMSSSYTSTLSGTAPFFRAGYGFTTDGLATYLEWGGWMPSLGVQFQQNSASFGFWSRNPDKATATGITAPVGAVNSTTYIAPRTSTGGLLYQINDAGAGNGAASTDGSGFYVAVRDGAASKRVFLNGAQSGSDATTASATRAATAIREGDGAGKFMQNQCPFTFAGRALTAAEVADLYDAVTEYLAAIGWVGTLFTLSTATNAAFVAQATTNLPTPTNVVPTPDVGPNVVAGKGFTVTGIAPDPRDGTWWIMSHGRNIAGDGSSNGQGQIVHTAADRSTVLGTIDLNTLTGLTSTLMQGLAFDASDNTLWASGQSSFPIFHISATTTSPTLIGTIASATLPFANGIAVDSKRNLLAIQTQSNGIGSLTFVNKDGSSAGISIPVATAFGDHVFYMADLDAYICQARVIGGNVPAILTRVDMAGQNYDAPRASRLDVATGGNNGEGVARVAGVLTTTCDDYYHSGGVNHTQQYPAPY